MKSLIASALLAALLAAPAFGRIWTDINGQQIEAKFRGMNNGVAVFELASGKLAQVKPDHLEMGDREYLKQLIMKQQQAAVAEQAPKTGVGEIMTPERFQQAIQENPNDATAYYSRGLFYSNKNEWEAAMADFKKALELNPNLADAYNARGMVYREMGMAAKAHNDFEEAIKRNPEMAMAYKNRGENLSAYYKTPEGKVNMNEALEKFRKKYNAVAGNNRRNTPWQPLNNTTGNVSRSAAIMALAKLDFERYRELEARHGYDYGRGGYGRGGYGYRGGPVVKGPAVLGDAGPQVMVTDPALQVMPIEVKKGETITLVANPAALAKGLVHKVGPGQDFPESNYVGYYNQQYRPRLKRGEQMPTAQDIQAVDFYRDVDGDQLLNRGADQYLASDEDGKDGYWVEVSTADFPPGTQSYFAVPRGGEVASAGDCGCEDEPGNATTVTELVQMIESLERAAQAEAELAEMAGEAGESEGLPSDDAQGLADEHEVVSEVAKDVLDSIRKSYPEVASMLKEANKPIGEVKDQLAQATKAPGEESKAPAVKASYEAKTASEKLQDAADALREAVEKTAAQTLGEGSGQGQGEGQPGEGCGTCEGEGSPAECPGDPQMASGIPAAGQGRVLPAEGEGSGDGKGSGGDGDGDGGNGDGDDDNDVHNDYGDDYHLADDDDHYRRDRDVVDRAHDYIDDGDYDLAVREYDRLVEDYPDNWYYLRERANTQLLRGGYDYAVRDYDTLISKVGATADLYYNRGCAYLAAGRLNAALGDFTKSIELNETWNLAWNNRGTTHAKLGSFEKAITDFTKAIELNPNDGLAYRNRALAYKKLGMAEKAEVDLAKAEELTPN